MAISCVMKQHKILALDGLSVRQLRNRRRELAKRLGEPEAMLSGSLVTQRRRCGKEKCRCQQGELHGPYHYLSAPTRGAARLRYVPRDLIEAVRRHLEATHAIQGALDEIAAINAELLARRELD